MIELSNRLGQIARMVQPGSVVADIGTDHGQLMVYLAQNGTIRRGYACDINEKPLNKARQIIADYGLEDRNAYWLRDWRASSRGAWIRWSSPEWAGTLPPASWMLPPGSGNIIPGCFCSP